jgi:hypothetical protein
MKGARRSDRFVIHGPSQMEMAGKKLVPLHIPLAPCPAGVV